MSDPMLEIIQGELMTQRLNRIQDTGKHIEKERREFVGKPEVCYELMKTIVYLRRGINVDGSKERFYELLDQYRDVLLESYDLRWLVSIADTLVDIGDPAQSAAAMNLVQSINYLNIIISLLDIVNDGRPNTEKLARNPGHKRPTFDGMISLDIYQGDMMYNLQKRLNQVAAKDELVNSLWLEMKKRIADDLSVPTNWLSHYHFEQDKKKFYHNDV